MRATTAFNQMLRNPGATVSGVTLAPEGIVVGLRRRFKRLTCPHCGWLTRAVYDRSARRWRHLVAGSAKLWLEAEWSSPNFSDQAASRSNSPSGGRHLATPEARTGHEDSR